MLTPEELRLFHHGRLRHAYRKLGAHPRDESDQNEVSFCTWAPHASGVSVVGDFNDWDGRCNPLQLLDDGGIWQSFIAGVKAGAQYKFEIRNRDNGRLVIRTDPYARAFASPGNTNAVVTPESDFLWQDEAWMVHRQQRGWRDQPISIYEVHASTWRKAPDKSLLSYAELARQLADYVRGLGCSHVELLPIFEHPLDESLGYQVTGFYAPTSRFGTPDQFRSFVDHLHRAGIGVILDWVPFHFPKDEWALVQFDGSPLYERDDSSMAEHPTWQTLIFNYGRPEVRNFLLANALFWLQEFHVDGLRVDAVSSMLYLDDARPQTFRPNPLGGRENLAAIRFLRELNTEIRSLAPSAFTIAEESTAFPKVCAPQNRGGLGFSMKWDMGWVSDTLHYLRLPWTERPAHHRDLTFGRMYAEKERYVLSFSHDEVMPGKGSLHRQMFGAEAQKMSQLRLLALYQFTYPGKKLNFMGNEFGQRCAWNGRDELTWADLQATAGRQLATLVADLNALYRQHEVLAANDFVSGSFEWVEPDDAAHSVIAYLRRRSQRYILCVFNFSPEPRPNYVVGVPQAARFHILVDSDGAQYGGSGANALHEATATKQSGGRFGFALTVSLAPLSGVVIAPGEAASR